MGFTKIKLFFVLILFHFLFLLPLYATTATALVNEPNAMDIEIGKNKEMTVKLTGSKRVVSVNRRAGGFGGRGFGGSRGGGRGFSGSRGGRGRGFSGNRGGGRAVGGGEETKGSGNRVNGRPTLIPFYTAGAMPHRQNNQQHHNGSNRGKLDSPSLLMLLLLVVYLFNILHS